MNTVWKWTALTVLALMVCAPGLAEEEPLAVIEINAFQERSTDMESIPGLERLLNRLGAGALEIRILPGADSGSWIQLERNVLAHPSGPELIRGRINPPAVAEFLREFQNGLAAMYAGFLDNVEAIEFTRDIRDGAILAEGTIELKPEGLPQEMHAFLQTPPEYAPLLPSPLPGGVVLASGFHTAPEATYAWLHQIAASDPKGPLRNLGFWIDEFEERTGRSIQADLVAGLGERGWFFLLEGDSSHTLNGVMILETRNGPAVDGVVRDLLTWWSDHARGRSLGLFSPRLTNNQLTFKTLFGELPGPAFEVRNGSLFLATSPEALLEGRKLFRTLQQWQPTVPAIPAAEQFAHESVRISGKALAAWIEMLESPDDLGELLHSLDTIALDAWYREDSIRISGKAEFQK
jgi:hypothetical protein